MRPVLLDLFCGAGGAGMGYSYAGFDVIGVDIKPQPKYPFPFIQADAMDILDDVLRDSYRQVAAIHASPPCQHYSGLSNCVPGTKAKYPDLVGPVRALLKASGLPWVIENVPFSPLIDPVILCGTSFGMKIRRHRLFESPVPIEPLACAHNGYVMNPYAASGRQRMRDWGIPQGQLNATWRREMGVGWMSGHEGSEAIPPAYTEYVGKHLMRYADHRQGKCIVYSAS